MSTPRPHDPADRTCYPKCLFVKNCLHCASVRTLEYLVLTQTVITDTRISFGTWE